MAGGSASADGLSANAPNRYGFNAQLFCTKHHRLSVALPGPSWWEARSHPRRESHQGRLPLGGFRISTL